MVQLRRRALLAGALALALGSGPAHRSASAAAGLEPEAVVRRVEHLAILALATAGNRIVAAGERGRILVSDDGGVTWRVGQTPTHHTLTSLAFTNAKVGFFTWRSFARPINCRAASVTCDIPPANPACPKESCPPCGFRGKSPSNCRLCASTNLPPWPFFAKPASSSEISTVIV